MSDSAVQGAHVFLSIIMVLLEREVMVALLFKKEKGKIRMKIERWKFWQGTEKCFINYVRRHLALVRDVVVRQLQVKPSGTHIHYSCEIFMGCSSPCLVSVRSSESHLPVASVESQGCFSLFLRW